MENTGFYGVFATLYQRVILSYKSTLLGLALVVADVLVTQLDALQLPNAVHVMLGLFASLLVLIKEKRPDLVLDVPPRQTGGINVWLLVFTPAMLMILMGFSGCSWLKTVVEGAGPKLLQCIEKPAPELLAEVASTLKRDTAVDELETLAVQKGIDVVVCAVQAMIDSLKNNAPKTSLRSGFVIDFSGDVARGEAFISKHRVIYVQ